ncbi:hemolysin III family protein [Cytophagales bacterium LB-30]|uniref:Hemolysin III family protein n=1 Tax=Shiella aurantiaca TaxID=3058365 RepID=A0ABT8F3K1_9BACT|nr:hemolysin III family protein [Shiella aurantiaca]MDN4165002.1 hemolysin III family protein [Shiella aurantiaca]
MATKEEKVNTLTHAMGLVMALIGTLYVVVRYGGDLDMKSNIGVVLFGLASVVLYVCSTFYHASTSDKIKYYWRKADHMAIYGLIAGTYTPFCLVALEGWKGYVLLAAVWTLALIGWIIKLKHTGKAEWLSTAFYLAMGWLALLMIYPLYQSLTGASFAWLLAGGVFYSAGTFFYMNDHKPYFHGIWHGFVLMGTLSHFFSVGLLLNFV